MKLNKQQQTIVILIVVVIAMALCAILVKQSIDSNRVVKQTPQRNQSVQNQEMDKLVKENSEEISSALDEENREEEQELEIIKSEPTSSIIDNDFYVNEKYNFKIKCPEKCNVLTSKQEIYINRVDSDGKSKGNEGSFIIMIKDISLEEFIEDYNKEDFSEIISQEKINFNGLSGTKMIGTNAIGINRVYIFINNSKYNFVLSFHDFNEFHKDLLESFKIID
jgi:hypothetical protein